jgi:hypothetical protein
VRREGKGKLLVLGAGALPPTPLGAATATGPVDVHYSLAFGGKGPDLQYTIRRLGQCNGRRHILAGVGFGGTEHPVAG